MGSSAVALYLDGHKKMHFKSIDYEMLLLVQLFRGGPSLKSRKQINIASTSSRPSLATPSSSFLFTTFRHHITYLCTWKVPLTHIVHNGPCLICFWPFDRTPAFSYLKWALLQEWAIQQIITSICISNTFIIYIRHT